MNVKYIVESKYANGDSYFDKFDNLLEVADLFEYLESSENGNQPDNTRILTSQLSVTTEEQ